MKTFGVNFFGIIGRSGPPVDYNRQLFGKEIHTVLGAHRSHTIVGIFVAAIRSCRRYSEAAVQLHTHTGLDTEVTFIHARQRMIYIRAELIVIISRTFYAIAEFREEPCYPTFYNRCIQLIGQIGREYFLRFQTSDTSIFNTRRYIGITGQRSPRFRQSI